ncbi:YdcF family protein [Trabulsiella odontotermitis]|uniref:DUF218 domain-containing protein n=1 Tax=Trabulsiella odontotermitis TaxID=379893 RepID=A0A0L0H265_9ENTR|nr:YdcF family protein [Trabulsiella odontotermitis]KNC95545.1 hypothetical protein GM31_00345 [Trabulsiella odontotermitis]
MLTNFPELPESTLNAANTVGAWLAQNDYHPRPRPGEGDLVVLAGNAVIPTIDAACQLVAAGEQTLLISGGVGHSTTFLYAAIARHPRYNSIRTTGRAEATILADIAHQFWNIPRERMVVEDKSTNCGQNAQFTRTIMEEHDIHCQEGIVVQDPTMQRRTMATFARVWQDVPDAPTWKSYPGLTPVLRNSEQGACFSGENTGLWPVERYLSLIVGELPRLRDDEQGYGPRGKGFISHMDIPAEVEEAWAWLRSDALLVEALKSRALL